MNIRLILFDLGGVLYNIEHARTQYALSTLQSLNAQPISFSLEHADTVFGEFDSGSLTTSAFISTVRERHAIQATDEQIINAWNAMLLGLYPDSISFIEHIRYSIPIALLSNINAIHHDYIRDDCAQLFACFDHLFLSYEMKLKKPDPEIFRHVISQTGYPAQDILFLDDTPVNCRIAESLGMNTQIINPHSREWLREVKNLII